MFSIGSFRKIVVGLSGGVDSVALFEMLKKRVALEVVHVDHGWRESSSADAEMIRQQVGNQAPFHLFRLEKSQKNVEAEAREGRMKCLLEVARATNADAIALAHHADDQAETVLKRLLEGQFGGMREFSKWEGCTVWRPLLRMRKKELEKHFSAWVEDPSNLDQAYQRNRIRHNILPELAEQFGKDVVKPLSHVGRFSGLMQEHATKLVGALEKGRGPLGEWWNLSTLDPFEIELVLKKLGGLSADEMSRIDMAAANKQVGPYHIDRGILFLLRSADWTLTTANMTQTGWKAAWNGVCSVGLPPGEYQVISYTKSLTINGCNLGKWYENHKVPAVLRPLFPVVTNGEQVVHEFLTGKWAFSACTDMKFVGTMHRYATR